MKGKRGRPQVPVQIRGTVYPDVTAAAKAMDVAVSTIKRARRDGRLDSVGLTKERAKARTDRIGRIRLAAGMGQARPVTVRGVKYPSHTAAADALGVSKSAVARAEASGRLDSLGTTGPNAKRRSYVIRGVKYETARDAAEELGVSVDRINHAARLGRLDTVGTGSGRLRQSARTIRENNEFKMRGRIFRTPEQAARAFGVDVRFVREALAMRERKT